MKCETPSLVDRLPRDLKSRPRLRAYALPGALLAALTLAGVPVSAHPPADGVQADHAYAADPLFSMTSAANLFPGHNPDGTTAMASTTKVMTLIVALDAVKAGVVAMDDDVTISFDAAVQPAGSSMMVDDSVTRAFCGAQIGIGAPLAPGEVMSFEDLLFGMMIPSGNNASVAIAEHVAEGYLGNLGSVSAFVGWMNNKASALNLTSTLYRNPVGYSDALHYTSARDLARLWNAGMADSEFRRIVRPQRWIATGKIGSTTKTYTMMRCGNYPGLEGHKNGRNTNCSGDQDECFVGSARRIGRRIVVSGMQADGSVGTATGDAAEVFDYAFNRLFHPDERGSSSAGSAASRLSLVCPTAGRAVSVSIPDVGRTQVTLWATDVHAQTYASLGTATAPTGSLAATNPATLQGRDVDAIALSASRVVTATLVGTAVELRLWSIPSTGAPSPLGAAVGTRIAGSSRSIELVALGSSLFATVARSTTNQLVIKTWRVTTSSQLQVSLTLLQTRVMLPTDVLEVDVASAPGQLAPRFVTVSRRLGAFPLVQAWQIDAMTGALNGGSSKVFTQLGTLFSIVPAPVEALANEPLPDKFYAIGFRRDTGGLGIAYARVSPTGALGDLSNVATAGTITAVELAPFGTSGIVSMTRLSNGTIKPIVWESFRNPNGTVSALRISDHGTAIAGLEPEICATPTTRAEGDFVSGLREGSPATVRLRGWRVADRP
jgi:D-alanyl-D-alanine carboxypeptidase